MVIVSKLGRFSQGEETLKCEKQLCGSLGSKLEVNGLYPAWRQLQEEFPKDYPTYYYFINNLKREMEHTLMKLVDRYSPFAQRAELHFRRI